MNKILGINNENYINTLLSKKIFSFKINKLSTTDNVFNGGPSDILYTGYLNKDGDRTKPPRQKPPNKNPQAKNPPDKPPQNKFCK